MKFTKNLISQLSIFIVSVSLFSAIFIRSSVNFPQSLSKKSISIQNFMWDKSIDKKKALVITRAFEFGGSGVRITRVLRSPKQSNINLSFNNLINYYSNPILPHLIISNILFGLLCGTRTTLCLRKPKNSLHSV
jgi:hypothetical protein